MTRWALPLGLSFLFHTVLAFGTLGWMPRSPGLEVTPGEAKVTVVFKSKSIPYRNVLNLQPMPKEKKAEVSSVLPEKEGVESTAPRSLTNPPPDYPLEAFRRGIQGITALLVRVDPRGIASSVVLERPSGSVILDEAAAKAVAKWIFLPARRAGVSVAGSIRIRIRFQIVEVEG